MIKSEYQRLILRVARSIRAGMREMGIIDYSITDAVMSAYDAVIEYTQGSAS
jgi:hypothetical protein